MGFVPQMCLVTCTGCFLLLTLVKHTSASAELLKPSATLSKAWRAMGSAGPDFRRSNVQGVLDEYFLKARGAGESERNKDACSALAAKATSLLAQLQCAESLYSPPISGGKQGKAMQKQKGATLGSTGKQKAKQARLQKSRPQGQGL